MKAGPGGERALSTETAREPKTARPSRRPWTLAALGLAGLALYFTWRATTLSGLPDIGDPFDVAAFADARVADDDNAFVLYRQAVAKLERQRGTDSNYDWATATESMRLWLAANAESLRLWRRGTERPDALDIPPRTMTFAIMLPVIQELRTLGRLARLEGSRLEAEGDLSGALDVYAAILRSGKHCGRRGVSIERLVGVGLYSLGADRVTRWAGNPKVDAVLLRRALAEVDRIEVLTPIRSEVVKTDYLMFLNSLNDPKLMARGSVPRVYTWPGVRAAFEDLPRLLRREPERSRRVVRLIYANWLAVCDLPPDRRPPRTDPSTKQIGKLFGRTGVLADLYALDATAPANARALSPEELARWWDSTIYAKRFLDTFGFLDNAFNLERATRASLLISLGSELYQRDHGRFPATVEELVGPYLKALPEGYVAPE